MQDQTCPIEYVRKQYPLDNKEISLLIIGGKEEYLENWHRVQNAVDNDPLLKHDMAHWDLGREDQYTLYCQRWKKFQEYVDYYDEFVATYAYSFFGVNMPGSIHRLLFVPTIQNMGTDKQMELWLGAVKKGEVIGCYAQTELGHGSDVQSLETMAIYDKETEQFVINSPTISSTKWWIGDAGFLANYCVTQAQLYVKGKHCGIQHFIVPLRDLETHKPLEGIQIGDNGPKIGFNNKDNGYIRFNNVRIPRDNMLQRFAKVSKHGEFKKAENEKIGYATMMLVRGFILMNCYNNLAITLNIAFKYSHLRKQFFNDKRQEIPIIQYQTQQEKLVPLLAECFSQTCGFWEIYRMLKKNTENVIERRDFSMMQDLHSLLSCSKATYTWNAYFGLDKIRQAMGGTGYIYYSGVPNQIAELSPTTTYEGENTLLLLQCARFLVKSFGKATRQQKVATNVSFLSEYEKILESKCSITNIDQVFDTKNCLKVLQFQTTYLIQQAAMKLVSTASQLNISQTESWNKHAGIQLVQCAIAFANYWSANNFFNRVQQYTQISYQLYFHQDSNLLATKTSYLNCILESPNTFYQAEYMTTEHLPYFLDAKEILLEQICPYAITLLDCFNHSENSLKSVVTKGNIYENLLNASKHSNQSNKPEIRQKINRKLIELTQPQQESKIQRARL